MTRNEHQMYSDVSSIAKSLEKIASVLEHMNHDSYLAKQDIPKFQDIPGFEGTLDALDDLYKPDMSVYGNKDEYETDLQGVRKDDDHDIRSAAQHYEFEIGNGEDIKTKKDAIMDYVTNEFGLLGARYTDIIKFAYYLGEHNAPKYSNSNRGYYSCAFNTRLNGHLVQGGKDFLVKGINKKGKERYFTLSSVNKFTDYYKRIS
tara:strand:+ start:427 stop:1035 length:609 start_codon:yes stop_codon:yes gene_type:complete